MRIQLLNVAKAVVSGDGAQVDHPGTFVYMSKRGMLLFIRGGASVGLTMWWNWRRFGG